MQATTGELLKEAAQVMDVLLTHIAAHATLTPSAAYTSVINQVNALIEKYNTMVTMRQSKEETVE